MTTKGTYLGIDYKLTDTTTTKRERSGHKHYERIRPVYAIKVNGIWKLTLATSITDVKALIRRKVGK